METADRTKRRARITLGLLLLALGAIIFRRPLAEALKLLLIAGVLALLLTPVCRLYERRLPIGLAAALSLLTAATVIFIALISFVAPLVNGLQRIYALIPGFMEKVGAMLEQAGGSLGLDALANSSLTGKAAEMLNRLLGGAAAKATGIFGAAADAAIAAVVSWYMLINRKQLALSAELILPYRQRPVILQGASEMRLEIMMYLRGQALIAICVGALSAIGLFLIGIPSAITLGFTTGLLNMIPYFGPFIATVPVWMIALTEGLVPAALAVGVLIAVQQIDGLILSPRIVGNATGFSPSMVMITIFAAGAVWGVIGMLAALPGLILIRTCVRVFVELGHND